MMTQAAGQNDFFLTREQYRMCRLQVFNWGTFDGLHDIPIAERGFLLLMIEYDDTRQRLNLPEQVNGNTQTSVS